MFEEGEMGVKYLKLPQERAKLIEDAELVSRPLTGNHNRPREEQPKPA